MSKALQLLIGIVFVSILYPADGFSSQCLIMEDFDDQVLDERLTVYGKNWKVLSPPQYNLEGQGKGGATSRLLAGRRQDLARE